MYLYVLKKPFCFGFASLYNIIMCYQIGLAHVLLSAQMIGTCMTKPYLGSLSTYILKDQSIFTNITIHSKITYIMFTLCAALFWSERAIVTIP